MRLYHLQGTISHQCLHHGHNEVLPSPRATSSGHQRTTTNHHHHHTSSGIIIVRAPIIIHRRTTKAHHHPCKGPSSMWAISISNLHQRTIIRGSNMTMTIMTTIINHISISGTVTTARVTHTGDKASNICCWHQWQSTIWCWHQWQSTVNNLPLGLGLVLLRFLT
jgi:hypothetical protein